MKKQNKKMHLRSWLENLLLTIEFLIIGFIATTIEMLGNTIYNKILFVVLIVFVLNFVILLKFSKTIQQ